jgi:hypothetical protein
MKLYLLSLLVLSSTHDICEKRNNECSSCENELMTSYTDFLIFDNILFNDFFQNISRQLGNSNIVTKTNLFQTYISLNYLCCHTSYEIKIIQNIIQNLRWQYIDIFINDVGCNVDTHNDSLIYLHLMLDNTGQNKLLDLAEEIEQQMRENNVSVNNSRFRYGPLFHIELATVNSKFDIMNFINKFDNIYFKLRLRTLFLTNPFTISVSFD